MSRMINLMRDRLSRLSPRTRWTLPIFAGTIVVAVLLSFFIDEPLRRSVERQMNARLTGYSVSIGKLRFHPIGLSLTLSDLVFTQQANPDPPVGRIPRLDASVQWRALLSWKLVANFALDRPKLYVNLAHLRSEAADPEPVAKHGWQEAFQAIYPLKINQLTIRNGEATYVDDGPFEPLELSAVRVVDSNVGFVNKAVNPPYRVFMSQVSLTLSNFSNQLADGVMVAKLTGKFMGSGNGAVTARFRPEKKGPDFDVNLSLENTELRTLNDVLRAYGKFDVATGNFSLFSEVAVKNNRIEGYVKPLFSDVDVYDPVQDRDKSLGRKLYEKVVEAASKLLKNAPRKEVATVATISGPVEDVKAHTVEVVVKLLQNAFFKAILPGFDEQVRLTGRRR